MYIMTGRPWICLIICLLANNCYGFQLFDHTHVLTRVLILNCNVIVVPCSGALQITILFHPSQIAHVKPANRHQLTLQQKGPLP